MYINSDEIQAGDIIAYDGGKLWVCDIRDGRYGDFRIRAAYGRESYVSDMYGHTDANGSMAIDAGIRVKLLGRNGKLFNCNK